MDQLEHYLSSRNSEVIHSGMYYPWCYTDLQFTREIIYRSLLSPRVPKDQIMPAGT